jgi:hypothetical protein
VKSRIWESIGFLFVCLGDGVEFEVDLSGIELGAGNRNIFKGLLTFWE